MPDEKPLYLHPTVLSEVAKCGYSAYNSRVLGWRSPPAPPQLVGSAVHRVHHAALKAKLRGADYQPDELDDLAGDALEFEWGRAREIDLEGDDREPEEVRGEAKDTAIGLSRAVVERLVPGSQVERETDLERSVRMAVSGSRIILVGRLDAYERGPGVLSDLKTAAKAPSAKSGKNPAADNLGLSFYAMGLQRAGERVSTLRLDTVTKTKDRKVWRAEAAAPSDHAPLLERISLVERTFRTGSFVPADPGGPSGWVCSERCRHWERCRFGKRRATLIPAATLEEVKDATS